ncbi:hypothetical protein Q8F55_003372 [Vanrija albida]|uniref:Granulins domain-containing protein n=1 Tax=Vanrija albida TaxID=181172 RepID=A0ABR3Q3T2_9TREE
MLPKVLLAAFALAASAYASVEERQDQPTEIHPNTRPGKGFDAPHADLEDLYSVLAGAAPEFADSVPVSRRRTDVELMERAGCQARCFNRYCVPVGSQCCSAETYCGPGYVCNKYRKGQIGCCKRGDRVCTESGSCLPAGYRCCGNGVMPEGAKCCGNGWCSSGQWCTNDGRCGWRRKGRDLFEAMSPNTLHG